MVSFEAVGRMLVIFGVSLAIIGGLIWGLARLGAGQMPGVLRINFPGGQCVVPILASLVLSVVLTVVLNLIARIGNR